MGTKRKNHLNVTLEKYIIHPVKVQPIIEHYAIIDAYSQGKLINYPLPKGLTSRNMGKNDLWIAATAYSINATLLTTDKDFDHLSHTYIQIDRLDINELSKNPSSSSN